MQFQKTAAASFIKAIWSASLIVDEANAVYRSNADVLESFTSRTVDELAEKRLLSSVR